MGSGTVLAQSRRGDRLASPAVGYGPGGDATDIVEIEIDVRLFSMWSAQLFYTLAQPGEDQWKDFVDEEI